MESYGEGYEEYLPGEAAGGEATGEAEASDSRRKQVHCECSIGNSDFTGVFLLLKLHKVSGFQ